MAVLLGCGGLGAVAGRAEGTITNLTLDNLYSALIGGGQITFAVDGTIPLSAPINIRTDTILDASGHSVTLSGAGTNRLFNVSTGVNFQLNHLVLSGGRSTNGGALFNDGGVVYATNCTFANNSAAGAAGTAGTKGPDDPGIGRRGSQGGDGVTGLGGAIYNLGALALTRCTLTGNTAAGGNAGDGGDGGNGVFQGGEGGPGGTGGLGQGGAIYSPGALSLLNCTFRANGATGGNGGNGGKAGTGLFANVPGGGGAGGSACGGAVAATGPLVVLSCSFIANTVSAGKGAAGGGEDIQTGQVGLAGGAALGGALCSLGTASLLNSTLFNNLATSGGGGNGGAGHYWGGDGGSGGLAAGGGLYNSGKASLTNCTLAANNAVGGAGGSAGTGSVTNAQPGQVGATLGGGIANQGTELSLLNTLLADNASGLNAYGRLLDAGHNLSSDGSCRFTAAGSLNSTDAKLGTLVTNTLGDYTLYTVALLPGSPAIDAGADLPEVLVDQRGLTRPQGAHTDIGAFERPPLRLSGRLTSGPAPLPGLAVTLKSLGATNQATTGADGRFLFDNLLADYYLLLPPQGGAGFSPAQYSIHLLTADQTNVASLDFAAGLDQLTLTRTANEGSGRLLVVLTGVPRTTYRLESSTDLINWAAGTSHQTDAQGLTVFTNTFGEPWRFFRSAFP